jgi:Ner family transcriptional regulator
MTKKPAQQDWSKAKIRYAVHERGLTFKGIALKNGYRSVDAISQCLHRPYPKPQRLLAEAIGEQPENIWPSRYQGKYSPASNARNVKQTRAA